MGAGQIPLAAMKFQISHRTTYGYRRPVTQSQHLVHLRPRDTPAQRVANHSLLIDPAPAWRNEFTDTFGNAAELLHIEDEHSEFIIHARSTVDVDAAPPMDLASSKAWEDVAAISGQSGGPDPAVLQFTCASRHAPLSRALRDFASPSFPAHRPVLEGAMDLTTRIFRGFKFDPQATDISTPVVRVLEFKRGVCQDFAHLSIAALRSLGLPARYVSGYLLTRPPPGQPKLAGSDASHAWVSVWAPDVGWCDFDPTNGIMPNGEHVTLAYGRDYDDISPITGVLLGGGDQTMSVAVDVDAMG